MGDGMSWHYVNSCPSFLGLALTYSLGTRAPMRGRDGRAGSSVVIAGAARIIETGKPARLLCGIIRHGHGATSCLTLLGSSSRRRAGLSARLDTVALTQSSCASETSLTTPQQYRLCYL